MHSSSTPSCYMPCQYHPPWHHYSNYTWQRGQGMELIMQFSSAFCHLISLRSK
jgi:hypothetical protein